MEGYRRFIAYVYEYPQGKKGNGKGFIKVEARDGVCRMQYKLAGIYGKESIPCKIYGYVRENGECRGILLGQCDMAGSSVEFEHETEEENMGNSGCRLEDLCGLILMADTGEMYGSGWDDRPVDLAEIRFPEAMMGKRQTEAMQEGHQPEDMREKLQPEAVREELQPEAVREELQPEAVREKLQPEAVREELQPKDMREKLQTEAMPEEREETEEPSRTPESPLFRDNSIFDCRKITPADYRMLGRRDRGLMNNKFLCYGYSNYGHLILGRREEDGRYILGIPGVYECQESLMAGMFGFPYFKETGGRQPGGRSGYWYRLIDTPDFNAEKKS